MSYIFGHKLRKGHEQNIRQLAMGMNVVQRNVFFNSPWPYAVLDISGNVKWNNQRFSELLKNEKVLDKNINKLISDIHVDQFPKTEKEFIKTLKIGENYYHMHATFVDISELSNEDRFLYVLTFVDYTELEALKIKFDDETSITSIIYIDNYDEVSSSMEEVKASILFALVDKKLSDYAKSYGGIVKKYEKDKYFFVFPKRSLDEMESIRFDILDKIRDLDAGNKSSITLSIGVGMNPSSLNESLEFSREAIDLARGRGGDQVIIKFEDRYNFYGGKTKKESQKTTRVKSRIIAEKFREEIINSEKIIIMGHSRPDLDAIGSAIGVYTIARALGKEAYIVLDGVNNSISILYEKLIEQEEYSKGLFIDSNTALDIRSDNDLLVVVDVNSPNHTEAPNIIDKYDRKVVFDHHRVGTEVVKNTAFSYVETYASSASEMITEILQYIDEDVRLEPMEAEALLAGITVDTQNFTFRTGVKTFEAAAFLKRSGANGSNVSKLFQNDFDTYKDKVNALKETEIYNGNIAIAHGEVDSDNPSLVAAQAANELLGIKGIKASFVLTSIEDGITVSARSFGDVNVQRIMEKIGGGGHFTAAGAKLDTVNHKDAIEILKNNIEEYYEEVGV